MSMHHICLRTWTGAVGVMVQRTIANRQTSASKKSSKVFECIPPWKVRECVPSRRTVQTFHHVHTLCQNKIKETGARNSPVEMDEPTPTNTDTAVPRNAATTALAISPEWFQVCLSIFPNLGDFRCAMLRGGFGCLLFSMTAEGESQEDFTVCILRLIALFKALPSENPLRFGARLSRACARTRMVQIVVSYW